MTETSLLGSPPSTPQDKECSVSVPIPSHSHQTPSPSVSATSEPMPSTSALATPDDEQLSRPARTPLTPRKLKLKKQLQYVSAERAKQQERYKSTLKGLKDQLKSPKRVENQAIKRTKQTISALKEKLKGHSLAVELADRKSELANLKAAHKRLKDFNKKRQSVPVSRYRLLQEKLKEKNTDIQQLENTNMILKEEIEELSAKDSSVVNLKSDMKSYSSQTRMLVFDYITLHVPTASIPLVLEQSLLRLEKKSENIPNRTTVELMARELGSIADYQCAEKLIEHKHVTIGFDATTQEGCHVNEIHFTFEKDCVVAAVDELAGGTAADYSEHILGTVENLIDTYCYFNDLDEEDRTRTKKKMIGNISNSLSDRCAANRAALRIVCSEWNISLNELNCHLHPLDSIASAVRRALKNLEESRGSLFGSDCVAANLILANNKLRFKDGKGDPRGFVAFLDKNKLPRGLLPRYRGNRLHILFHISGILIQKYNLFLDFYKTGPVTCGGLRLAIYTDFNSSLAKLELCVLGLIGKLLTAPWMRTFYTSCEDEINHVQGIEVVRRVTDKLRSVIDNPVELITAECDLFGNVLADDPVLIELRQVLQQDFSESEQYKELMKACLTAILEVLQRQYSTYFKMDVTEKLKEETRSARSHNIDAEEIMGMFSASQKKAPHATVCFLSCRMRAKKNRTVKYLDGLSSEKKEPLLRKAVTYGRKQRDRRRIKQKELRDEIVRRQEAKKQKKEDKERKGLEKKLNKEGLENVLKSFPDISEEDQIKVTETLDGKLVGRRLVHVWSEESGSITYNGKVEKFRKGSGKYKIGYWQEDEDYDDATDWEMCKNALAVDLLLGELLLTD